MRLFDDNNPKRNLLPEQGEVYYHGPILNPQEAIGYYNALLKDIAWKQDEAIIYGKHYITKRKAAWYGDKDYAYTYSNTTKYALPWIQELKSLKTLVESITKESYNSCLLNLYHNGEEGMAWHSDDEKALVKRNGIASLSLGTERTFAFRHKITKEKVSLKLEHGSLLVMTGDTQTYWQHQLTKSKKIKTARINLTFRKISE